jgi:hypothetical protein
LKWLAPHNLIKHKNYLKKRLGTILFDLGHTY